MSQDLIWLLADFLLSPYQYKNVNINNFVSNYGRTRMSDWSLTNKDKPIVSLSYFCPSNATKESKGLIFKDEKNHDYLCSWMLCLVIKLTELRISIYFSVIILYLFCIWTGIHSDHKLNQTAGGPQSNCVPALFLSRICQNRIHLVVWNNCAIVKTLGKIFF